MSGGDTLVIEIGQKIDNNEKMMMAYVFYDYKTRRYGLRFGKIDSSFFYDTNSGSDDDDEACIMNSYSYYVRDGRTLVDFLLDLIEENTVESVSLLSYRDLPKHSDYIKFETLLTTNKVDRELISHYQQDYKEFRVRRHLEEMLRYLHDIYNKY
jgi:hypothetical protein